jgi:hypothetical protein
MLVGPDANIAVGNTAMHFDRSRFGEDQPGATLRHLAQMHQVPVVNEAVFRRVGAHRRDHDAVLERDAAQFGRRKQKGARCHVFLWMIWISPDPATRSMRMATVAPELPCGQPRMR